jgi:hypothetical protein
MVFLGGCAHKTVVLPQLVYDDDLPEVKFPRKPPIGGNVKDLELYSGLCTIELERLDEELDIFKQMLNKGVF